MFKKTAIFLFTIVVLVVCLSSCDKGLTVNEKALLEYPGLEWNMTPEEVQKALNISDNQIKSDKTKEANQTAAPYEMRTVIVQDISLFGTEVLNVIFGYLRYENNDFGLCSIEIYYPEETDMQLVVDNMTGYYGEGTDDSFVECTIRNGEVVRLHGSDSFNINGELWEPEKDPNYIRSYWCGTKKGTEVLSKAGQEKMVDFYVERLQITPEVALEYLEKQPMVQVRAVSITPNAVGAGAESEGITHNYVRFSATYLVMMIQQFGQ